VNRLRKNRLGGYGVLKESPPQWRWLYSDTRAFTAVHTVVSAADRLSADRPHHASVQGAVEAGGRVDAINNSHGSAGQFTLFRVDSRRFASLNSAFPQLTRLFATGRFPAAPLRIRWSEA
jgi:hypothetical protein